MGQLDFKCGAGSRVCEDWENLATAVLCSGTNLLMIPTLVIMWKQELRFESMFGGFVMLTSTLYHYLEPMGGRVLSMNDGQWHRLDNIGAAMCFVNVFLYLCDFRSKEHDDTFKFGFLFLVLILQERGPWEVIHTVIPIVLSGALFVFSPVIFQRRHEYHWRNFWTGMGLMILSFIFFGRGLDDRHDYLRLNHVIWHVLIAASSYWLWRSVLRHLPKLGGNQQARDPTSIL